MIALGINFAGTKKIVQKLKRSDQRFAMGISKGLRKAGLFVQRESQLQVPVEFGFMKASAYTRNVGGTGFQTRVVVGYTAHYAAYVHERVKMSWKGLLRGAPYANLDSKGRARDAKSGKYVKVDQNGHKGRYWDPQGRAKAKFLEDPVYQNADKITRIVREEAFVAKWL